jgi:DNA-binding LacI/PurR family transcriptional regulator
MTSGIRAAGVRVADHLLALLEGSPVGGFQEVWPVQLVQRASVSGPSTGNSDGLLHPQC